MSEKIGLLTEIQCRKPSSIYYTYIKNILKCARSALNPIIKLPEPYRIKDLKQIQTTVYSILILNALNNDRDLHTVALIRLKKWQIKQQYPENILVHDSIKNISIKGNLLGRILVQLHKDNQSISSPCLNQFFEWKGGNISIRSVLNNQSFYKKAIASLKVHNIMFLDQIVDSINGCLID